jgi:type IV protein arginine methyltransferase
MVAAGAGHVDLVKMLLHEGCPWNQQDRAGRCAGEHAQAGGHADAADVLLDWACRCELLLGSLKTELQEAEDPEGEGNVNYLAQQVTYDDKMERLMDEDGEAVMMQWEDPLMKAHAALLCHKEGLDVVNIGERRERRRKAP